MMAMRLAIDTGGTFTDFVLIDDDAGDVRTLKTASTPPAFADGVIRGIDILLDDLARLKYIFHGATIGVNTLIEERGEAVALLTTHGFEDVLEIGWMNKPDMYNLMYSKPRPLIPRPLRKGIHERVGRQGEILEDVDPAEVRSIVEQVAEAGVKSIAICTLNAYLNSANERKIAQVIRQEFPELHVSVSTEIVNQRREFERMSTTVLNAFLVPIFSRYLRQLEVELKARRFGGEFFVMKSNGGVMPLGIARAYPVHTLLSGPVGGAIGAQALGRQVGLANVIGFDMGGTSTDVSLVVDGAPQISDQALVHGYPVMGAAIDIGYIGAGGGSMATIEGISSLRVGPQSAGAIPGPVSYGRGGTVPCVTDANLLLGRLDPSTPLADEIALNRDAAASAVESQLAARLGLTYDRVALGVVKIAEVKMGHAIRRMTIEQGLDPRDFALVAYGGAGPMHACGIAAQLGIPTVIIPASPGTFSAWGMLNTDIRHDTVRTIDHAGRAVTQEVLEETFRVLDREAEEFLAQQGVDSDKMSFSRLVDARYKGQEHTINVPFPEGPINHNAVEEFLGKFHALHERKYAHSRPGGPVEIINTRVTGFGHLPRNGIKSATTPDDESVPRPFTSRTIIFEEWSGDVPIYRRSDLRAGSKLAGPAVVVEYGSTTILLPGLRLRVDRMGNLLIDTQLRGAEHSEGIHEVQGGLGERR